ncbi:hypothetical protein ACLBVW_36935, partial [Pseudomonas aeruginosa]|uniref:hypothetical protein n=1 Tax=Pseudomonas aeruginosa TaxID=287 RepID=UPI00396A1C05
ARTTGTRHHQHPTTSFHYYHAVGGKAALLSEYWQSANRYTYLARLIKGIPMSPPQADKAGLHILLKLAAVWIII